jgi:hypothetical protein
MFPHNDGLITTLIKSRQAEIRQERERLHLVWTARAARPAAPRRLDALLQRVRRWTIGAADMPSQQRAQADPERQWSA